MRVIILTRRQLMEMELPDELGKVQSVDWTNFPDRVTVVTQKPTSGVFFLDRPEWLLPAGPEKYVLFWIPGIQRYSTLPWLG